MTKKSGNYVNSMHYTSFGNSGLLVSRMGLGLAALGRPGYINLGHSTDLPSDHDEAKMHLQTHLMLDEAVKAGISYLDAAQSYGRAEEFLASWLRKEKRDVAVGSKWGYYYTANWSVHAEKHEIKEHTIERLNQQWPESTGRLTPYLKLYQIHSATFESGVLDNKAVLDRLGEIRDQGTLIGLSVSGPKQGDVILAALNVRIGGKLLFGSVQATFNILEQSASEALRRAADLGLGVIIKEGVANGRLTYRGTDKRLISALQKPALKQEATIDALALGFILHQPFAHVVLSGAANPGHLHSNLKGMQVVLSNKELAELRNLAATPESYWKERGGMQWN